MSTDLVLDEMLSARAKAKAAMNPSAAEHEPGCGLPSSVASSESVRATQQASRIEPVDPLSEVFAHDLNNLLTVILGHTEFLLKSKESSAISRSRVEEIRKAAERAASLAKQFLAHSRNHTLEPARRP